MTHPVCLNCNKFYAPHRNGGATVFQLDGNGKLYKYWYGDLYRCPECGHEIACEFGNTIDVMPNREKAEAVYEHARNRGALVVIE